MKEHFETIFRCKVLNVYDLTKKHNVILDISTVKTPILFAPGVQIAAIYPETGVVSILIPKQ